MRQQERTDVICTANDRKVGKVPDKYFYLGAFDRRADIRKEVMKIDDPKGFRRMVVRSMVFGTVLSFGLRLAVMTTRSQWLSGSKIYFK